ncbi:NlpC/P60 family protein [Micromonospora pattaloongensis]|uniref:NlpC/P60 family protein n=1 Tax=Micromonospora pattaloongensis TaxID=405436 RepID=A0A1H3MX09_9ACTN|nr:transglycosylase SLT domain-containing protein [Micromonospora pattaloongensis]SDY81211.1 NlpC/P60 family protein [Micromonospora pattaloongensis]
MTALVELVSRVQQIQQQLGVVAGRTVSGSAGAFASELSAARSATGTTVATGAATGNDVVAAARKYLGVPYVFGGTDPATGLDCSGLVQRAYRDLGITLPRIAADQAKVGTEVPSLAQAKPGDLLAFNSPVDHIAIYIGDGKMIAAPQPGENVKIQDVYQKPVTIRRIIPDVPAVGGAAGVRPAALRTATDLAGVPYAELFSRAGAKHGVSAKLLAAVAKVESGYNPRAVSPAGAQGLMQLMPATAKGLGVTNAFDPTQAVDGAARMLASLLKEFDSVPLALAAYNAGGGAVRRYGGIPPYAETQAYVPKVQAALAALG